MEKTELLKRASDLALRAKKQSTVTSTHFLTPAEKYELQHTSFLPDGVEQLFSGGCENAERTVCLFYPDWMEEPDITEFLSAVRFKSYFGAPGHRDYLGAILGSGVNRE